MKKFLITLLVLATATPGLLSLPHYGNATTSINSEEIHDSSLYLQTMSDFRNSFGQRLRTVLNRISNKSHRHYIFPQEQESETDYPMSTPVDNTDELTPSPVETEEPKPVPSKEEDDPAPIPTEEVEKQTPQQDPIQDPNTEDKSDNTSIDYPKKTVMTTWFYVGEKADASNDYITNTMSYWDENWQANYGGADSPADRCGYQPCAFTPKENPFYFALPYGERDNNGKLKANVKNIPWYDPNSSDELIKNRWIEVSYEGKTCYAQWEDVGPGETDDFDYVFGDNQQPANTFGLKAGLDISPAVYDCLGMKDNAYTTWRFVDAKDVPAGPWKEIITR